MFGAFASSSDGLTTGETILYADPMTAEAPRIPRRQPLLDAETRERLSALYKGNLLCPIAITAFIAELAKLQACIFAGASLAARLITPLPSSVMAGATSEKKSCAT